MAVPSAVVVIDVQEAVLAGCADAEDVVRRINGLVRRARSAGTPVIFIQHEDPGDPQMTRGTPGWQLAAALDKLADEPVVAKTYRDSFAGTGLAERLSQNGVRRLVVTGAHSDYCVQMTALAAVLRGYDVRLVSDAHTAQDDGDLAGARIRELVNDRFGRCAHRGRISRRARPRPSSSERLLPPGHTAWTPRSAFDLIRATLSRRGSSTHRAGRSCPRISGGHSPPPLPACPRAGSRARMTWPRRLPTWPAPAW